MNENAEASLKLRTTANPFGTLYDPSIFDICKPGVTGIVGVTGAGKSFLLYDHLMALIGQNRPFLCVQADHCESLHDEHQRLADTGGVGFIDFADGMIFSHRGLPTLNGWIVRLCNNRPATLETLSEFICSSVEDFDGNQPLNLVLDDNSVLALTKIGDTLLRIGRRKLNLVLVGQCPDDIIDCGLWHLVDRLILFRMSVAGRPRCLPIGDWRAANELEKGEFLILPSGPAPE